MKKRWIIRSLALMLLTLCVLVWVGSYWKEVAVANYRSHRTFSLTADSGYLCFCTLLSPSGPAPSVRWELYLYKASPDHLIDDLQSSHHFIGFGYELNQYLHGGIFFVPLWFPTLLLLTLNWFVWRKTKPKPQGGAFPIEPTAKPGESKP